MSVPGLLLCLTAIGVLAQMSRLSQRSREFLKVVRREFVSIGYCNVRLVFHRAGSCSSEELHNGSYVVRGLHGAHQLLVEVLVFFCRILVRLFALPVVARICILFIIVLGGGAVFTVRRRMLQCPVQTFFGQSMNGLEDSCSILWSRSGASREIMIVWISFTKTEQWHDRGSTGSRTIWELCSTQAVQKQTTS